MTPSQTHLVVVATHGADHELSSVALTIACGGVTAGLKVYLFLTSSAVDLVRKRAVEMTQVAPLTPLKTLLEDFMGRGGTVWACPPCTKSRGYAQDSLVEGVSITSGSAVHELIKGGAATLSF